MERFEILIEFRSNIAINEYKCMPKKFVYVSGAFIKS